MGRIRFALRSLAKAPLLSIVVVVSLRSVRSSGPPRPGQGRPPGTVQSDRRVALSPW